MAATRKSPKTVSGTIKKITPLRKSTTPKTGTGFRGTRKPLKTPPRPGNIFSSTVIANTGNKVSSKKNSPSTKIIVKKTPARKSPAKKSPTRKSTSGSVTPTKLTLRKSPSGRVTPTKLTLRKTPSKKTTPGRVTPGRVTPGRVTPGRVTPGRVTPGRVRKSPTTKASPKRTLNLLKPKSPSTKTAKAPGVLISRSNQFLYNSLTICCGLIFFVIIVFGLYKIYEYFNPSEEISTDSLDFIDELEDIEKTESTNKEEEEVTTKNEDPVDDNATAE